MKVLVADDDNVIRHLLKTYLTKWGYEPVLCKNGDEAWEEMQAPDYPRLVILDWMMPGKEGIEICRMVREQITDPYVYVMLLTSKSSREEVLQGLEAGADDYMAKPFDDSELKIRLYIGERIINLQKEFHATCEELQEKADHDDMTGLWNHRVILDILKSEISRGARERMSVGVLMADLDHFKKINDKFGHPVGDGVLAEVARRLAGSVRSYDAVGRYGGEEFLLVLPGCVQESLKNMTERFRSVIEKEPIRINGHSIPLTISIGATLAGGMADISEIGAVVKAADNALYEAKAAGRNRTVVRS